MAVPSEEIRFELVASCRFVGARRERNVVLDTVDDLARALDGAGVGSAFDALSSSHRRQYVMWIDEAKRPATRARRVAQTVERLADDAAGSP